VIEDDDMPAGGPDEAHPCPKCGRVAHASADGNLRWCLGAPDGDGCWWMFDISTDEPEPGKYVIPPWATAHKGGKAT
jgi:hypothetical protein